MIEIINIIVLPIVAGIIFFALPVRSIRIKAILTIVISALSGFFSVCLFLNPATYLLTNFQDAGSPPSGLINSILTNINIISVFRIDSLARLLVILICFYALFISIYCLCSVDGRINGRHYFSYLLITSGAASGAVMSDNLLFFIFFWGILGISLYKLIKGYDEESAAAAKKSLILIGASDSLMILGIALVWQLTQSLSISSIHLLTNTPLCIVAFLCLLIGSFTKAGAFPFHSWVPDFAQKAPSTSSAYLPASLDKLLGIYFLSRLCIEMFKLNQVLIFIIILIGSLTIIIGVMMALIQHNYKKLLGYHAVSQVGYMILGLGLGTPLGIAGGLFHMVNNTLYKSGLFLVGGNISKKTGIDEIEPLGGLSRSMPITFVCALIFALSISGVPPMNGFASKWLIYQAIIDFGRQTGLANSMWIIWLGLAVVGSALTLASFLKFLSGIFLGRKKKIYKEVKEVAPAMWIPVVCLAIICVLFGVFASNIVIPKIIMPLFGSFSYTGIWSSSVVGGIVLISIILGILFYMGGKVKNLRIDDSFIGGETQQDERTVNVVEFYTTISKAPFFATFYKMAEKKWFDIYDISKNIVFGFSKILSRAHTGILPLYTIWIIAGIVILMLILM